MWKIISHENSTHIIIIRQQAILRLCERTATIKIPRAAHVNDAGSVFLLNGFPAVEILF